MNEVKIIEIKKSIFEDNNKDADRLREELRERGVFLLNLMSSPGSGKTTTLVKTINLIKSRFRIAVMEADIDSDVDAKKIKEATGIESVQLHTGGMCHLDAEMTRQGLASLPLNNLDLVVLENVGNLVCPAEFDTGSCRNMMILSVPEGHDKPLKYPLMFSICDLVLINKMDVAPYFDFDIEECKKNILMRNPKAHVIPISAKTGEGIPEFADWLVSEINDWRIGQSLNKTAYGLGDVYQMVSDTLGKTHQTTLNPSIVLENDKIRVYLHSSGGKQYVPDL